MKEKNIKREGTIMKVGLIAPVFVAILLVIAMVSKESSDIGFLAIPAMIATIIYFFTWVVRIRRIKKVEGVISIYQGINLLMFSATAYILNITFPVFFEMTIWMIIALVLMHLAVLGMMFSKYLPRFVIGLCGVIYGSTLIINLVMALWIVPLYVSIVYFFFFGLTLLTLVPVTFFIYQIHSFIQIKDRLFRISFSSGLFIAVILIFVFTINWNANKKILNDIHYEFIENNPNQFPEWMLFAQKAQINKMTKYQLLSDVKYQVIDNDFNRFWDFGLNMNFGEKEFNPLIVISDLLSGNVDISRADKVKILNAVFDQRHQGQRRLWSGSDLEISEVITSVDLYPQYRLAYSESVYFIRNNSASERSQQEALFSFYLPEGAVATSLSLWIKGIEEKSRLTTRQKADSAYSTIVGRERRDPALLHWQEGNVVTVAVFPCTPEEPRKLKVGFTIPLIKKEKELLYKNINFKGPDAGNSKWYLTIRNYSNQSFNPGKSFEKKDEKTWLLKGEFETDFRLSIPNEGLMRSGFSFQGETYNMHDNNLPKKQHSFNTVWLDLNRTWTEKELEEILEYAGSMPVYYFSSGKAQLTKENLTNCFNNISDLNFSLFPFHSIKYQSNCIVIGKSNVLSPNLKDLEGTVFSKDLYSFISNSTKSIKYYNLNESVDPYLNSLNEFKVIDIETISDIALHEVLKNRKYYTFVLADNQVLIKSSDIIIESDSIAHDGATGPDHLFRLWAFNKIMKSNARKALMNEKIGDDDISLAEKAFIVSPISSLIVLETQHDYERFNIKENQNSLGNVQKESLKNWNNSGTGSVPEPHEWALIIIAGLFGVWFLYKNYL
jgi:XrtN system VIT domain protein